MFSERFKVRFCETDGLSHVSNTVLVQWFETAREPIFRLFSPQLDLSNWPLILASYKVDFVKQLYYGKEVEVHTHISRIGNSAFDVYQEVWQDQQKCATGLTTLVNFDFQTQQSKPIDMQIKSLLMEHKIDI